MNIACIGAHPDDVDLAMGGTVVRMVKKGHNVRIYDLSNGEPTPFGTVEIRSKESQDSASLLGAMRITLDFPNRYIFDSVDGRKQLAEEIRTFRPEIIFTHYLFDAHPDHISSCSLVEAARFYSKLTKSDILGEPFFPSKIFYFFPNHANLNILPDFCVDISNEIEIKKNALLCFESQFIKKGNGVMIENILAINRYYGIRISKQYAEPFISRESLDVDLLKEIF
jgi:N-acetylglucosamine malate deacetylase 1